MKIIKRRTKIDKFILGAALVLAMLPVIGLLTGTAFSPGLYGANYQEASIQDNPERFWFLIKLEFAVVAFILFRAWFEFPLIYALYRQLLAFKEQHKILAYCILYLIVPVLVVILILFLISVFELN